MDYSQHVSTKNTPQNEPTIGKDEVKNAAGGFVFGVDEWSVLDRFLILGTAGGTFYVKEHELTKDNAVAVLALIKKDGPRVVNRVVEISHAGRATKNDPALFVLAMAAKLGNEQTRKAAFQALTKVARIGTHLFHFCQYMSGFGGWGRATKNAVARWYNDKPIDSLINQVLKYQQRDGWSHRDLLRLSHPVPASKDHNELYRYIVQNAKKDKPDLGGALRVVEAFEELKKITEVDKIIEYVREYRFPHECVPTQFLKNLKVWDALLPHMGLEAITRNLGKMSSIGFLAPMSEASKIIADKLDNADAIRKSRLHPIKILMAMMIYKTGHGVKGNLSWTPVSQVIDALDKAFYLAFSAVEPTGKRLMLSLDVSGSMEWGSGIGGVAGLTPRVASAAMALITAAVEPNYIATAFTASKGIQGRGYTGPHNYKGVDDPDDGISALTLSARQRLDDVVSVISKLTMGSTDCALPMLWALKHKVPVDAFVIFTDNESWTGKTKSFQALDMYRQKMGIGAKAIAVGMTATDYSVFDDKDPLCLNVVGFDSDTPSSISNFVA